MRSPQRGTTTTIKPNWSLTSDDKIPLYVPRSNLISYGDRAFSHAALTFGTLCLVISDQFKSHLKSYLFKKVYKLYIIYFTDYK